MRDPVDSLYGSSTLRTLPELAAIPSLALLGEPGIGKSLALIQEHDRVGSTHEATGIRSIYIDLNSTSDESRLYRRVFESSDINAWKADASQLRLHLDSLDEAMLRIETVPSLLAEGFRELPADRLSVRIACRTAVWPEATLGEVLSDIWGLGAAVLEMAPLRRRDVYAALEASGIDPDAFARALFAANAVAFAIKPLTLKMLITLFKRDGQLPAETGELYRLGCLALTEEQNRSRRETRRHGQLSGRQRLRVAGRLAVATALGNRNAIWNGPETEMPVGDVAVPALAGSQETGDFQGFSVSDDDIREVLDTGLFTSRGERRMGWAHRSYQEFLAADYLVEKGVPPKTILKALTHSSGALIPPLAVVGAWAASLSSEVRASLIATDPWSLLRGDLTQWAPADLAALVVALLSWVEAGRYVEFMFGVTDTFGRLKHPDIASQLRPIITDGSLKPITRRRALSIAERCKTIALEPELLSIAEDRTEDHLVRASAVSALRFCGGPGVPDRILAMMEGDLGPDPQSEIRGEALELLWPQHINADQLFPLLHPSNESFAGAYAYFLFSLPSTLNREHLAAALGWATSYIKVSNLTGEFREKTLADAIMFKAWDIFEDPSLSAAVQENIEVRLRNYGALCRGSDFKANETFSTQLRKDTHRRRQFLRRLCVRELKRDEIWPYWRAGFVQKEDFAWLIAVSPGGATPDAELSEQSLLGFVTTLFDMETDHFERLYDACNAWPALRAEYEFLIEGVAIDSAAANDARARRQQLDAMRHERPPPAVADLPAEIERLLKRAEQGEWQAWWELNLALTLTPESRGIGDELSYSITGMPGWESSDDTVRRRIIATAVRYLAEASAAADLWLGKQPMTLQRGDLAAFRAFVLLLQTAQEDYYAIPTAVWEMWTPVIVGLPRMSVSDRSPEIAVVLQDALAKAPTVFVATVKKIISVEKDRGADPEHTRADPAVAPFFILQDLDGCWESTELKDAVFEELQKPDLKPVEYAALLEALLKAGHQPAIDHALTHIVPGREGALQIATVLLRRAPAKAWPILWPMLSGDEAFARALLTQTGSAAFYEQAFYAELGAEAVADLYLLMVHLFPPETDPKAASGFVSPLDMIPNIRDGTVRYLASMGTSTAVHALMRLVAARPDIPLLPFELSRGEEALRVKSWSPLTVQELLSLTDRPGGELITSPSDLLEMILTKLERYAADLHGAQTPARDLWDRQGTTQLYRPKDENGFSDVITRYLRRELQSAGLFANREVEVKRQPGAPVGQRVDILVNALRKTPDGKTVDAIAAVIEVKGCWNKEVFTALNDQLVRDYMTNLNAPVGIFLVGWFEKAQWDPEDSRRRQTPAKLLVDVRAQLDEQALGIPAGFQVKAMVLDIKAPGI